MFTPSLTQTIRIYDIFFFLSFRSTNNSLLGKFEWYGIFLNIFFEVYLDSFVSNANTLILIFKQIRFRTYF